ncbi:MAG: hypothetical protein Q4D60_08255 [Eubacteriales bacterium]|nr:hypothetical protein [Eubacteriales bacterium]
MKSFEEISKMNLSDLDRPDNAAEPDNEVKNVVESEEKAEEEKVTVDEVEGKESFEDGAPATEIKKMRQPEGEHYYIDAKISEHDMIVFLFSHNYRQPIMILAMIVALIWPVTVIVRQEQNLLLALALAAIVLIALPFSTWNRGKKTVRNNPAYQQTFHYMVDEWGLHLELGGDAVDVEWSKVMKCFYYKSEIIVYTGKVNAFLIPTSAMGENVDKITEFIKRKRVESKSIFS